MEDELEVLGNVVVLIEMGLFLLFVCWVFFLGIRFCKVLIEIVNFGVDLGNSF